jgi:hypothetical protein
MNDVVQRVGTAICAACDTEDAGGIQGHLVGSEGCQHLRKAFLDSLPTRQDIPWQEFMQPYKAEAAPSSHDVGRGRDSGIGQSGKNALGEANSLRRSTSISVASAFKLRVSVSLSMPISNPVCAAPARATATLLASRFVIRPSHTRTWPLPIVSMRFAGILT